MATAKQKKAAANRMKAAAKIMKSDTATKAEKASAKRKRDAANKIRTSKTTVKKAIVGKAKKERDKDTSDSKTKTKTTAKGPFFFGTNIPLSAVADAGKRNEINARLKTDIAAGDWSGANDALFSAAFNTVKGGKGQGNPNVSKVHSGEWKVNKSPMSWAETAINSSNDVYKQKDGSVVSWDDKLGALKDGVSIGSWGGQGKGENQPHSGQAPPKAGVKGAAPINPVFTGTKRKEGRSDINRIFGAGTTDGRVRTTGGAGTGGGVGGLLDSQYGGRVGEYQVPNRSFNWQTDPTEQALMASAMGRPDLAQMMLTGQYGPLAGQQYQYGGGQTRINYGGAGAGAGLGGTGGRLGPLGGARAGVGAGAGAGAGAGPVIPAAGGGGGLSLGGLGGLSLGGLGRPTMGGGRVQGGNVQSVADIKAQEESGLGVDQFAVNQMALPSLLSGRQALPSASWTAPANPYGVQPGGYTTGAVSDFRNRVANTPMGIENQGVDFATLPPALPAPTVPLPPQLNATVPATAATTYGSGVYNPFGMGNVGSYGVGTYNPVTGTGGF